MNQQSGKSQSIATIISFSAKNENCFAVKLFYPILYCIQRSTRSIFHQHKRWNASLRDEILIESAGFHIDRIEDRLIQARCR